MLPCVSQPVPSWWDSWVGDGGRWVRWGRNREEKGRLESGRRGIMRNGWHGERRANEGEAGKMDTKMRGTVKNGECM